MLNRMPISTFQIVYLDSDTLTGNRASFLAKYSEQGVLLWVRSIGGFPMVTTFRDIALDTINHVIYAVGGYAETITMDTCLLSTSGSGGFLAKWTTDGACLWIKNVSTSSSTSGTGLNALSLVQLRYFRDFVFRNGYEQGVADTGSRSFTHLRYDGTYSGQKIFINAPLPDSYIHLTMGSMEQTY